jgi:hypothetical protein
MAFLKLIERQCVFAARPCYQRHDQTLRESMLRNKIDSNGSRERMFGRVHAGIRYRVAGLNLLIYKPKSNHRIILFSARILKSKTRDELFLQGRER